MHEARVVLDRYSVSVPYILSVATWEPRKNIPTLIEAFLEMKRRGELPGYKLVLVGGRGWKDRKLASLVENLERENVIPVGYVPDEHLPFLYSGAELFVFPSTYEGFGMPVLEARACGTRVVASDIPELREAGGSNSVYVIPTAQGIREGILAVLSRNDRTEAADLSSYSWETGAAELAAVLVGGAVHGLHGNAWHS
jgi:glycosyltransferase involved in cell wall biosynthesis